MPDRALVIDTNIVLDLFVFADPAVRPLRALLDAPGTRWYATPAMRGELAHVLGYAPLQPWLRGARQGAADVLARFDARARLVADAPSTPHRCRDADDQKFIDLAVAHRAQLLSRDKAVLRLRARLAPLGVRVAQAAGALLE